MLSVKVEGLAALPILPRPSHNSGSCGMRTTSTATSATAMNSSEKEKRGYTLPIILSIGNMVATT